MNKETRGNMCKNKLISKLDLPKKQSGLRWSPERLSLPLSRPRPRLPVSTRKCHRRVRSQPRRLPAPASRPGPKQLFPGGETESERRDARCWLRWKGRMREGLTPRSPGRSQRSRGEPPSLPQDSAGSGPEGWGVPGDAGPAVLHGRGRWRPGEWQGRGRSAPVRRQA